MLKVIMCIAITSLVVSTLFLTLKIYQYRKWLKSEKRK